MEDWAEIRRLHRAEGLPIKEIARRLGIARNMMLGFSRFLSATMIPSRQGGDILSGMWALISQIGRVSKTLVGSRGRDWWQRPGHRTCGGLRRHVGHPNQAGSTTRSGI